MNEKEKEEFLAAGGDPRWFDEFTLSGKDVCALVQAGTSSSIWGMKIFDHPDVEKILKGKSCEGTIESCRKNSRSIRSGAQC